MKGFAEGGSYLLVGCPYCICYTSKDAFSTCFSLVSFSWLTRENPQPDRSFFFKFWAGSPERIRSCRVERRRILRSCWVHPRLACCFWAPFFLALLLTRYVVWAARYLATQHVAVLQVLAQVQMKPRWQNSAVEMQMALSPKSCPTAASETTTFSVASMPTILWIVWKRTLVSLLTVALVFVAPARYGANNCKWSCLWGSWCGKGCLDCIGNKNEESQQCAGVKVPTATVCRWAFC